MRLFITPERVNELMYVKHLVLCLPIRNGHKYSKGTAIIIINILPLFQRFLCFIAYTFFFATVTISENSKRLLSKP